MEKERIESKVDSLRRSMLFAFPVAYEAVPAKKCVVLCCSQDSQGNSIITHKCIEDEMSDVLRLDYQETTLSNLLDKGVDPKALAIIDVQKLGVDAGVDQLANYILDHASDFVITEKNVEPKNDDK